MARARTGQLIKRPSGYYARVSTIVNGERVRVMRSLGTANKENAEHFLRQLLEDTANNAEVERDVVLDPTGAGGSRFGKGTIEWVGSLAGGCYYARISVRGRRRRFKLYTPCVPKSKRPLNRKGEDAALAVALASDLADKHRHVEKPEPPAIGWIGFPVEVVKEVRARATLLGKHPAVLAAELLRVSLRAGPELEELMEAMGWNRRPA